MREYELTIIVHPDLDENALKDVVARVQGWIVDSGGSVNKTDLWGKRRLAYAIRKQREGQYVMFDVNMTPKYGSELERNLRLYEPVMRFLLAGK
jgi:small subunit ribosomal protein S6